MAKRGSGEGSIYQRGSDGRWVGSVHLGYDRGRRKRKVIYGDTRTEVSEAMKQLLSKQQQGLPLRTSERLTVGDLLTTWLGSVEASVRSSTHRTYAVYVKKHLAPHLGRRRLSRLTPSDVESMTTAMVESGLSERSAHHARAILRRALRDAERDGLVGRNAAALSKPPHVVQQEPTTLSPRQAIAFVESVERFRDGAVFILALSCGLRIGEATGLCWDDVDLDDGTLTVRQALQRDRGEWVLVEPKSRTSHRQISMPKPAIHALRRHRRAQLERRVALGQEWGNEWDLVFTTESGQPLNHSSLTRRLRKTLEAMELPSLRFQDLRHSCASLLVARGVHPRIIMETLGHSSISLTMNTYSHVMPQGQREAADEMERLLAGS